MKLEIDEMLVEVMQNTTEKDREIQLRINSMEKSYAQS